eukprot:8270386-Pyramimonas_sp.AAC.1
MGRNRCAHRNVARATLRCALAFPCNYQLHGHLLGPEKYCLHDAFPIWTSSSHAWEAIVRSA